MKKTVIAPGQGVVESDELDGARSSVAVATHHHDCTRVELTGLAVPREAVRDQTREVLGLVSKVLDEFGGTPNDLVKTRWHVVSDAFDQELRATIHEVRDQFIDGPHYPPSVMVTTPELGVESADFELDATATIPDDGWTVETIEE